MNKRIVAQELRKIADKKGRFTAEDVVDVAKHKEHPLHSHFEWNDSEAAHKYRIYQANQLIASVKVEIQIEYRTLRAPMAVRDPDLPAHVPGYRMIESLTHDEDAMRTVLVEEFSQAAARLRRARDLAVAFGMSDRIAELEHQVIVLRDEVRSGKDARQ